MNLRTSFFQRMYGVRAKLVVSLVLLLVACTDMANHNLMMGTIQFPSNLASVPAVRVYRGGRIIECVADEESKRITLTIPREPHEESFYLLISETIQFLPLKSDHVVESQNTIGYFRVPKNQPYKLYKLTLACDNIDFHESVMQAHRQMLEDNVAGHFGQKEKKKKQPTYYWKVTEQSLSEMTRQIPDDTIIVYYYPHLIDSIIGGTKFEFPTIKIKQDLLALVGSETKLQELSDVLVLSSLDHASLHASIQQQVRFGKLHTLVAAG